VKIVEFVRRFLPSMPGRKQKVLKASTRGEAFYLRLTGGTVILEEKVIYSTGAHDICFVLML
jgi:hypothetical protein